MSSITNLSRRGFLIGLAGTGALVLRARYLPGVGFGVVDNKAMACIICPG
jgi:hypothetical protein